MKNTIILLFSVCWALCASAQEQRLLVIDAGDFKLQFYGVHQDEDSSAEVKRVDGINIHVALGLGYTPENQVMQILGEGIEIVGVFQNYETSVTVMDEGPHLDLVEWKHFNSPWVALNRLEKNKFKTVAAGSLDFPKVKVEEFKSEVLKMGGERWYNVVKDNQSLLEGSVAIGVSKIRIKIKYLDNNIKKEKILSFKMELGC